MDDNVNTIQLSNRSSRYESKAPTPSKFFSPIKSESNTNIISPIQNKSRLSEFRTPISLKNNRRKSTSPGGNRLKNSKLNETHQIINLLKKTNKTLNYSNEHFTGSEIKAICLRIFMNYSKFNDEEKGYFISFQTLLKLLKNITLINERNLKATEVDIILQKINPNGSKLDSEQFMDLIAQIALKIDTTFYEDPQNSIIYLIKVFFEPLAKGIEMNSDNPNNTLLSNTKNNINQTRDEPTINVNMSISPLCFHQSLEKYLQQFTINRNIKAVLNSVRYGLKEIYTVYFHYEVNKYTDKVKTMNGSYKNFVEFCKDFEIVPYLISLDQIATYWNMIITMTVEELMNTNDTKLIVDGLFNIKDIGNVFTFAKFAISITHMAVLSHNKINLLAGNISDHEKLIYFLEKLEMSKGFKKLFTKLNRPNSGRMTLIPSREAMDVINPNIIKRMSYLENKDFKDFITIDKNELISQVKLKSFNNNPEKFNLKDLLTVSDSVYKKIESNLDILREIFQMYSKSGDKINFNKMGYSSYLKFLRDSHLLYFTNKRSSGSAIGSISVPGSVGKIIKETGKRLSMKNSYSKSPIRGCDVSISINKTIDMNNPNSSRMYRKSLDPNNVNINTPDPEKLTDLDVSLIFSSLTGSKNFDNRKSIKSQFDKNKGYINRFGEGNIINTRIDKTSINKNTLNNVPLKMDFYIFVKSFELVANKLYPNKKIDESMNIFLDKHLVKIIQIYNGKMDNKISNKCLIKEELIQIRSEKTVYTQLYNLRLNY